MKLTQEQWKTINWMNRQNIQTIMEDHGFAIYETESWEEIKNALADNIQDGSIPVSVLEKYT